ncbi:MAG TPA: RNA polymerase sigma factor [Candidatus Kapabacteria bacterium]|nr:RNA polymerase sigma factor [Candidatus Kapabacteria bacterium]
MNFRISNSGLPQRSDADLCAMLRGERDAAERAFKELYRRYASRIHAYCYKILSNKEEAEDVFQETFVKFYTSAQQEREMTNVAGYLFRIARNLSLNRIRDRSDLDTLEGIEIAGTPDRSLENSELLSLIASAVELLDLEFREAFVLREYENMPYEEIADLLGISVSNAKSRVFRARQKIKKLLAPNIRELR